MVSFIRRQSCIFKTEGLRSVSRLLYMYSAFIAKLPLIYEEYITYVHTLRGHVHVLYPYAQRHRRPTNCKFHTAICASDMYLTRHLLYCGDTSPNTRSCLPIG
jgi:hypothetical protein